MTTILLIEDNPEVLENTAELLELEGYQVDTATDGREGVEIACRLIPDLIISDIMMPKMDGYQVLKKLSSTPDTSTIPFIFLTAKTAKAERKLGFELGADDYLTKPYRGSQLVKTIGRCLRKKKALKEHFQDDLNEYNDFILLKRTELIDWLSEKDYQN